MNTNKLSMVVRLALLMSPMACSANQKVIPHDAIWRDAVQRTALWPNPVKELPLYEIGPSRIVEKVFIERTSHSLTLGARMKW